MSSNSNTKKAAWFSFIASIFLLALKAASYQITGSSAVLSDALESIVNVITAVTALGVLRFAEQPADREHPYGHGKAEYVSASFEGGLIVFAAVMIFIESARALIFGVVLQKLDWGFALLAAAALLNLILGLYLRIVAQRDRSEALMASSKHVLSDVKTTAAVIVGLLLVQLTGRTWLDPLAAMLIALHLAWDGGVIVRHSLGGLVDEMDLRALEELSKVLARYRRPGLIEIHQLRAIRAGRFHHIDAHLVVPEYWDVEKANGLTQTYEREVVREYAYDAEIAFHLDPCRRLYCAMCDVADCPIRQVPFEKLPDFGVAHLIGQPSFT